MRRYVFRNRIVRSLVGLFDLLGDFLIGRSLKQKPLPAADIKKILVLKLDHLGDGILFIPFMRELKDAYPQAEIWSVFSEEISQIRENTFFSDSVRLLTGHWFSRKNKKFFSFRNLSLIQELRRQGFDLAVDPRGDLRNILFLYFARTKYRISYGTGGGGFLLHREIPETASEYESDRNLKILETLGHTPLSRLVQLTPAPLELSAASKLPAGGIVIHAGAGTAAKRWPLERWVSLIRSLLREGRTVVLVGKGEWDEKVARFFQYEKQAVDLVDRLNLNELWTLLQRSLLFIGCDSGLAHAAGALGVKTLVLESGTNEAVRWGVRGARVKKIRFPVFCSPCHLTICRYPSHDCMMRITENEVHREVKEFLSEK